MTSTPDSDLLSWLTLFWSTDEILSYDIISDGYFLNEVFKEIDPNAVTNEQLAKRRNLVDCIKNWEILIKNIRVYYMVVLQQAFVVRLPSIITICYDQHSSKTQSEIDKTIFLILGAAVQCERKEYFIQDIINRLPDESIQHGLMGYIKQITEGTDTVINCIQLEDFTTTQFLKHLKLVSEQWEDSFIEEGKVILTQNDVLQKQIVDQKNQIQVLKNVGVDNGLVTFSSHSDKNVVLELAECKAKMRKLQNELDDKSDIISDLRDDLELQQDENTKLKENQMKLINESRRLRMLQDELDSQKELILRLPTIEAENVKLREKVNELEYYRVRCEELREDLVVIANENSNLMDKIENNKKIVERSATLEVEYRKSSRKIEDLEQAINGHLSEISTLEYRLMKMQENDNAYISSKSELENELKRLQEGKDENIESSMSDQVIERTNAKLMRLEIENRILTDRLSDIKTEESNEFNKLKETISELEEEKERLLTQISRLQNSNKKEIQNNMEIEEKKQIILREKHQLDLEIKLIQENKDRRIEELVQENENLSETIMIIRERFAKSNDLLTNELEKENSKLHLSMNEGNHKLSKVEFDLQRMTQKSQKLESSLEKSHQDHLQLSKKNAHLEKEISNYKLFKSRLEELQDKFSVIEVEKLRLEALVSEYYQQLEQTTTASNNTLEENMKELAIENQRRASQLLKKISELESELLKTKTENEKFVRQINRTENKIKSLEEELENSKTELANFSRLESKLKLTEKNLAEVEKEREELQSQNLKLEQEIKNLEKENRRLKNQYEVQCSSIEKYQNRISDLETKIHLLELNKSDPDELETIQKSMNEAEKRLTDSEQKNRELFQQVKEEKRQCSTLREELLNERLDSQNLKNQLQKLTDELDKAGILEFEANEKKFKLLESKVNSTVDDTLNKKEEKIKDLKSKLASSIDRNKELVIRLQDQTNKYHSLQQKYEEELGVIAVKNNSSSSNKDVPSFTQHLLDLKDDIIKLERQNAQLDSENQFLNTKSQELNEKLVTIENKHSQQLDSSQKRYNELNNENMKIEIEKSTLKSQLDTLRKENANLSNQISVSERNLYSTADELKSIQKLKQQLELQCSSLQNINNQLSTDYEQIKNDVSTQKSINKSITTKLNNTNEELMQYKKDAESLKHLKEILETEKNSLADGARQLISLREENNSLIVEKNELMQSKNKLEIEFKSTNVENKFLKTELRKEKDLNSQLNVKIISLQGKIAKLEAEISRLEEKIDSLTKQNEHLKEDHQVLLKQMKSMLMQNQELITETLQNRQNQHSEELVLRERLNNLQRQKERLEEKIMDQYKSMPSTKKPRGGRNKFLKKAKEMLKRRDSKSSIEQERKDSIENPPRYKRSRSCGTILGERDSSNPYNAGDRSVDYQYDHTDASDKERTFSDSDGSEIDFRGPVPKLKSSRLSNADTYSMSSTSQREPVEFVGSENKLIPGSMSMYDRDDYERRHNSEIYNYLMELHDKKVEMNKNQSTIKRNESQQSKQVVTVKNISKGHQRSQPITPHVTVKKQLPPTLVSSNNISSNGDSLIFGNITSTNNSNQNFRDNSSVSSNDMSIIVAPTKKFISSSQPSVPTRKASLPVTERVEEEFINTDVHDIVRNSVDSSRKSSYSSPIARPQSTIPASASSKAILQRLQKNSQKGLPPNCDMRSRGRPQTPTSEITRLSSNNNPNSSDASQHYSLITMKPRPQSSMGSIVNQTHILNAKRPIHLSQRHTIDMDDLAENKPTPPLRRESGKIKSNQDSGSNASDKSEKTVSKQKLYHEYGNV